MNRQQAMPPADYRFTKVSLGQLHSCGITKQDGVKCWGQGEERLEDEGILDYNQSLPPKRQRFADIASGSAHTCALDKQEQFIQCWGAGEEIDEDEGPEDHDQSAPPPFKNFESVAAGALHTCGLTEKGKPKCWGLDSHGQVSLEDYEAGVSMAVQKKQPDMNLPNTGQRPTVDDEDLGKIDRPEYLKD
jgi:alpha-tubulin suppressor-like RCC1 family protein